MAMLTILCGAAEAAEALHAHVPIFRDSMDASRVHLSTLAEWLADSIFDEQEPAGLFLLAALGTAQLFAWKCMHGSCCPSSACKLEAFLATMEGRA
jgi:hypothetical protein